MPIARRKFSGVPSIQTPTPVRRLIAAPRARSHSSAVPRSLRSVCSEISSFSASHCVLTGSAAANSRTSSRSIRSDLDSAMPPPSKSTRNAARRSSASSSRTPCPGLRTKRNPAARSHFSIPGNSRMTVRRLTPTLSPKAAAVSHTGGSSDNLRISRRPLSVSIGRLVCCSNAIPPLISLFVYSYISQPIPKRYICPRPAGCLGRRQFWPCRLVPNPYISRLFPRYSRQITQICHACLDILHKCPAFGTIISGQLCHKSCLSCRAPAGTMEPQNESPSVSPSRRTGHTVPRQ